MKRTIHDFNEGEVVEVYANENDIFHDFEGKIAGFRNDLIQVIDMDDDVYEVDPHQVRLLVPDFD